MSYDCFRNFTNSWFRLVTTGLWAKWSCISMFGTIHTQSTSLWSMLHVYNQVLAILSPAIGHQLKISTYSAQVVLGWGKIERLITFSPNSFLREHGWAWILREQLSEHWCARIQGIVVDEDKAIFWNILKIVQISMMDLGSSKLYHFLREKNEKQRRWVP